MQEVIDVWTGIKDQLVALGLKKSMSGLESGSAMMSWKLGKRLIALLRHGASKESGRRPRGCLIP